MRLKTKLVLIASGLTFAVVLVLSVVFLGELLRQKIYQTNDNNDGLAHNVLLMTRQAVESGLRAKPPADRSQATLDAAVADALRSSESLLATMNGIVRYFPTVQDVSVTDADGIILVSTDPDTLNLPAAQRTGFSRLRDGGFADQLRLLFGRPRVLDVTAPLDRNGAPFLVVHVGVRSTFLRNSYAPWLRDALVYALLAAVGSMLAAGLFSNIALRPLVTISEQLEQLTLDRGDESFEPAMLLLDPPLERNDAMGRVNRNIDRLGREMRSREEGYTALQANLNQMLDTLRDGVLLFTGERRAVMVSDAVAHFLPNSGPRSEGSLVGRRLDQIFPPQTALGAALLAAFDGQGPVSAETVSLEDGRQVQISLDRIDNGGRESGMGTLVTLRDTASALELEQELEVSRRLAAIGRLTAGVGHEVKNPINAMVVHLELLRSKLADNGDRNGARKHVDILADEMQRLDRVVQTLADFSRPMELDLREHDLRPIIQGVLDLTGAEMKEYEIHSEFHAPDSPVMVLVDGELLRQALLNLLLNGMQAMPSGGILRVSVRREHRIAIVEIADNGVGIPVPVLPRIFDLYFTTKPKGSGIGLSMTYRILQLHGGTMEVRSNAEAASSERGTTFILRLPVSVAPAGDPRSASGAHIAASRLDTGSITTREIV